MTCRPEQYTGNTLNGIPWSNWAGLAGGPVEFFKQPNSLSDIVHIVQEAQAAQPESKRVRVEGSGWAFEDIAYSPQYMVSLGNLKSVLTYVTNENTGALLSQRTPNGRTLVHVEAGIKVWELNNELGKVGLAMPTLGGANGQSLVGALSTSTHGADFNEPPFCDLVHAIHLVGVNGQEYWIERASAPITSSICLGRVLPCPDTLIVRDDELFDAVIVGLGRFGIIYSLVIEAVPAYSLARERTMLPFPVVMDLLRAGISQGTFVDPVIASLPPPSPNLNAIVTGGRPRAMELIIDTRNPGSVHVVRRWEATGDPIDMAFAANPLCDAGAGTILVSAATLLVPLGMDPLSVNNPLVLLDPTRPPRLAIKQAELLGAITNPAITPGEALALVTNAYWEFDLNKVPDLLALVVYHGQFKTQRGPSYDVMTGDPSFNTSTCYRANSCEIMFDAADSRYIDFVTFLAGAALGFRQAGYISLRYSRRSRALLSMHNVASGQAVSIEVSTLKSLQGSAAWIENTLLMAQAFGGRPHWGQQNHPSTEQVSALYGAQFDRWRAVLGGFSGTSTLFSSGFTAARGLEPQGTRDIQVEGVASELSSGAPNRIGVLKNDGQVHVKEGDLGAAWVLEMDDCQQVALAGDRIGVLKNDGQAFVKEGDLGAAWVLEMDDCQQVALAGNRIGVLTNSGQVHVKEGDLGAAWVLEMDDCQQVVLAGNRIGILKNDGQVHVKEGGLDAAWVLEMEDSQQVALAGNRIGVLKNDGQAFVKEGDLGAAWVLEMDSCQQVALAGNRIGILKNDGQVHVKEGGLDAAWVLETEGCEQVALAGNRIGVLKNDGQVHVKEGGLDAAWVLETEDCQQVALTDACLY